MQEGSSRGGDQEEKNWRQFEPILTVRLANTGINICVCKDLLLRELARFIGWFFNNKIYGVHYLEYFVTLLFKRTPRWTGIY